MFSSKLLLLPVVLTTIDTIIGATIQAVTENLDQNGSKTPSIKVECKSGYMLLLIENLQDVHSDGLFSGMIYPKGLPNNSTCLSEYRNRKGIVSFKLPLRSCNTMPQELNNGEIEFFNTIVVQPHLKLVTDLGRGFHVRCKYKNRQSANAKESIKSIKSSKLFKIAGNAEAFTSNNEKSTFLTVANNDRSDFGRSLESTSVNKNTEIHEIPMPAIHMKIYKDKKIANSVHIGDPLQLIVSIEKQNIYGLQITNCLVRDGLGWGEQILIDKNGCPTDYEIMGAFKYNDEKISASVTFPAHKFPYTTSVYYQCNVNLCLNKTTKCLKSSECNASSREKRQIIEGKEEKDSAAIIEVYSGLYVNENADVSDIDYDVVRKKTAGENELCVSQRTFAISISVAGLILMLAIVASVICIMSRKRTKSISNSESSIYSGPYTNTAFSQSS